MKKIVKIIVVSITMIFLFIIFPINSFNVLADEDSVDYATELMSENNIIYSGECGTISTANPSISGYTYVKFWNKYSNEHCFNKFSLKKDGAVGIGIVRSDKGNGNYENVEILVYNSNGSLVWQHDTSRASTTEEALYYFVGLASGIYYIDIKPYSTIWDDNAYVGYRFVEYDTSMYEKESNDGFSSATYIEPDHTYDADFATSYDDIDYFSYNVRGGVPISIYIGNYSLIQNTNAVLEVYDSNCDKIYDVKCDYNASTDLYSIMFTPKTSGTFYFEIHNCHADTIPYTIRVSESMYDWTDKFSDWVRVVYGEFATYEGFTFVRNLDDNITCIDSEGNKVINQFKCDGTYTYYFQADGTAMKNRLTYHPDGEHVIYFDEYGHEVFSDFAHVLKSISGDDVDDYCFFDVYGYLYVNVLTYNKAGSQLLYANEYGRLECNGWFQFSDTVKWADGTECIGIAGGYGYGQSTGYLLTNIETTDWLGRNCYLQGNGVAAYIY